MHVHQSCHKPNPSCNVRRVERHLRCYMWPGDPKDLRCATTGCNCRMLCLSLSIGSQFLHGVHCGVGPRFHPEAHVHLGSRSINTLQRLTQLKQKKIQQSSSVLFMTSSSATKRDLEFLLVRIVDTFKYTWSQEKYVQLCRSPRNTLKVKDKKQML